MPAPLLTLAMAVVAVPTEQVPTPAPVESVAPAVSTFASAPVLIADAIAPGDPVDVVAPGARPAAPPVADTQPPVQDVPVVEGEGEDIIVQARVHSAVDPFEGVNVAAYSAITAVDEAVIGPVAKVYERGLPPTLRRILSNFFSNLREPIVAFNYLLQLKPGKAAETLAPFTINSTAGFGGLNDVARERPFNSIYYGAAAYTIDSLDFRIEFDEQIRRNRDSSDPYVATRDAYLARRRCEIEALHNRAGPECDAIFHPAPAVTDEVHNSP